MVGFVGTYNRFTMPLYDRIMTKITLFFILRLLLPANHDSSNLHYNTFTIPLHLCYDVVAITLSYDK